ncbi:hypothetical protein FNU76_12025 [Chitinimonas arctica]|uniref:Uncharacterized protein n=1 Tax=Chitinimonas arctica TaxID=2594795 RepID=A0A516SFU4_9NEIS|nr:hypothetical protein [Chitinimonas arctica]QDQ27029.1 hypothetical protein FNU76_12025 [Chitinimonas arctica]
MLEKINELNSIIKEELWYDFYIDSYKNESIVLKGTLDASYGHNLEIRLEQVSYIDAPLQWKTDTTDDIVVSIFSKEDFGEEARKRYFDNASGLIFGFKAECFDSKQWFYFIAQSFSFLHKGKWDSWSWYDKPTPPPIAGINE